MTQTDSRPQSPRPYHELDISSSQFWSQTFEERERTFARLRADGGFTWHQPLADGQPGGETGFWAVTRHEDIVAVSRNHQVFSSAEGVSVTPLPKGLEQKTSFFLVMDPPDHMTFRRLISGAFTPKQIGRIKAQIQADAREIVRGLVGAGDIDFVAECSTQLPMRTVSDMIGIAPKDRDAVRKAAEVLFAGPTEEDLASGMDGMAFVSRQVQVLREAAIEIARERRRRPKDDLMTNIVQAEIGGRRLTDDEIGSFMVMISTAGNDTTKQTTSLTALTLARNPEQKRWLMADLPSRIDRAVDEFVRHGSPVMNFARIAKVDTEIGGTTIRAGEKVALFYCSGNRDESVFDRPNEFVLSRSPNPHIGFGGGGIHFCLGHTVAKTQLSVLFSELLTRVPDMEVGEPEWLPHRFVHGIKRLPVHVR
ncbi:cytochrome P450 [Streptomyces sp. NPDC005811]|uniref:cytochrome P450 n=1 Tax=Streptomyces sp. NPDC005811 TaxID=3154565 RepID=UPI0033C16582